MLNENQAKAGLKVMTKADKDRLAGLLMKRELKALVDEARVFQAAFPDDPFPVMAMASAFSTAGKPAEAAKLFRKAIELNPDDADAHYNLGVCLKAMGDSAGALSSFRRALSVNQHHVHALNAAAQIYMAGGDLKRAEQLLRHAVRIDAANVSVLCSFGTVLQKMGKHAEAESVFSKALELNAANSQAHAGYALVLRDMGRHEEAIKRAREGVDLDPKDPGLWNNLGTCHLAAGDQLEAIECFNQAVRLKPGFVDAIKNLAKAHSDYGIRWDADNRFLDRSVEIYKQVLARHPSAIAHSNLALALERAGNFNEAVFHHREAVNLEPHNSILLHRKAQLLLRIGDLEEGWLDFEHRLTKQRRKVVVTAHASPPWNGEDLDGKSLVILSEQGLGDQLQFFRYALALAESKIDISLEAHPKLVSLFSRACPGMIVVPRGEPLPEASYHAPIMSLPRHLGIGIGQIEGNPYLNPDGGLESIWKDRLQALSGKKVGIHWQGNPAFPADYARSFPLEAFRPLAQMQGLTLVSVQAGDLGKGQMPKFRDSHTLYCMDELAGTDTSYEDLAAIISALDVLVTSDTSIAHLAGALGKETHLVLGTFPDWRWFDDQAECRWYSSVRVWRQRRGEPWADVINRISNYLKD